MLAGSYSRCATGLHRAVALPAWGTVLLCAHATAAHARVPPTHHSLPWLQVGTICDGEVIKLNLEVDMTAAKVAANNGLDNTVSSVNTALGNELGNMCFGQVGLGGTHVHASLPAAAPAMPIPCPPPVQRQQHCMHPRRLAQAHACTPVRRPQSRRATKVALSQPKGTTLDTNTQCLQLRNTLTLSDLDVVRPNCTEQVRGPRRAAPAGAPSHCG